MRNVAARTAAASIVTSYHRRSRRARSSLRGGGSVLEDAARPLRGHLAVVEHDAAVDDDVDDAVGVDERLLVRALVDDRRRIEDDDIGGHPRSQYAPIEEPGATRW